MSSESCPASEACPMSSMLSDVIDVGDVGDVVRCRSLVRHPDMRLMHLHQKSTASFEAVPFVS